MTGGEPSSFSVVAPARRAREILAPALSLLQCSAFTTFEDEQAILHAASASSSLYRVETEARTPEAAAAGIHAASERLARALKALSSALPEHEPAAAAIARALALLYPITQATQRKRRHALAGRALSEQEREVLERDAPAPTPAPKARIAIVEERRSAARVELELDMGLYAGARFLSVLSLDVSSEGAFLRTQDPLPAGTSIILHFILPGGQAVEAEAEVRWTRATGPHELTGMGVRFVNLSAEDQSELRSFSESILRPHRR